jgi:microsomal dipeptidase-like Zn-dependent dipeptidase
MSTKIRSLTLGSTRAVGSTVQATARSATVLAVLVPLLALLGNTTCPGCQPPAARKPLVGFVDLHTHPVANLGFGGKLFYGGVSPGARLPRDPACNQDVRVACQPDEPAACEALALGHDGAVHGGPGLGLDGFENTCGNAVRELLIHVIQNAVGGTEPDDPPSDALGFPTFQDWPRWNDLTHQRMWVEWIRRSFTGGLRVMVALAVNNRTLGDAVSVNIVPGTFNDLPTDDRSSADLQIAELQVMVDHNTDFMEIARTAEDIARITSIPKLAVVIGVEVDHLGNLKDGCSSEQAVKDEIHRLYDLGVRYIFPIHLLDNALGGTAVYDNLFNASNARESGSPWALECAPCAACPECAAPVGCINYAYQPANDIVKAINDNTGLSLPMPPRQGPACGERNSRGLTPAGVAGILEMMRLGMLIDIDHMSEHAAEQTLALAEGVVGGYPLNSGHNAVRVPRPAPAVISERALTERQYRRLAALHGMAGVGSGGLDAEAWLASFRQVTAAMRYNAGVGFGTDTNGFAPAMPPRRGPVLGVTPSPAAKNCEADCPCEPINSAPGGPGKPNPECGPCKAACNAQFPGTAFCAADCDKHGSTVPYTPEFPISRDGAKTWDYNTEGVAHYGMLPDFLKDVASLPGGQDAVAGMMGGAEYFYQTWRKAEAARGLVPADAAGSGSAAVPIDAASSRCSLADAATDAGCALSGDAVLSTDLGAPIGPAITATIGAAGGTVATPDGRARLTIPIGALASDTAIGITRITNECPGGTGEAYRITPAGIAFATPASLALHIADSGLANTAFDAVAVAMQRTDRAWVPVELARVTYDRTARTLAVPIAEAADWAPFATVKLDALSAAAPGAIFVDDTREIGVFSTYDTSGPLHGWAPATGIVATWAVNGIAGGDARVGTVAPGASVACFGALASARYTAPSAVPRTPVTITGSLTVPGRSLVAEIATTLSVFYHRYTIELRYEHVRQCSSHASGPAFHDDNHARRATFSLDDRFAISTDRAEGSIDATVTGVAACPQLCPADATCTAALDTAASPSAPGMTLTAVSGGYDGHPAPGVAFPDAAERTLHAQLTGSFSDFPAIVDSVTLRAQPPTIHHAPALIEPFDPVRAPGLATLTWFHGYDGELLEMTNEGAGSCGAIADCQHFTFTLARAQ